MIQLRNITRSFGDRKALDDVSFDVPAGELVGFVGGNGAGKTTSMRILMGVLTPDSGEVRFEDHPITAADRRAIGYMPEERGLYPKQRVLDQLVYLAELRGATRKDATRDATTMLDTLGLGDRAKAKVETLSLGNQQRVQIVAALIGRPRALVLDEPFSGLDPTGVDGMVDLLRTHTTRGVAVLFSSHQLDLVQRLCDRLVVISAGTIRLAGSVATLRADAGSHLRLTCDPAPTWVPTTHTVTVLRQDGNTLDFTTTPDTAHAVLADATRRGTVTEYRTVTPSLAEIYRKATA